MTDKKYQQKKRECWEDLWNDLIKDKAPVDFPTAGDIFEYVFPKAFAIGKQEKDAVEPVIQGWVGRDLNGSLYVYCHEPERNLMKCIWEGEIMNISISDDMLPDLTWESDPIEVELIIKRKKNGK